MCCDAMGNIGLKLDRCMCPDAMWNKIQEGSVCVLCDGAL